MKKVDVNKLLADLKIYTYQNSKELLEKSDFVFNNENGSVIINDNGLTEEDVKLYLIAKQTECLKSIRAMLAFFTILVVLSACFWILTLFQ